MGNTRIKQTYDKLKSLLARRDLFHIYNLREGQQFETYGKTYHCRHNRIWVDDNPIPIRRQDVLGFYYLLRDKK